MEVKKLPDHGSSGLAKHNDLDPPAHAPNARRRDQAAQTQSSSQLTSRNAFSGDSTRKSADIESQTPKIVNMDSPQKDKSSEQKAGNTTLKSLSRRGSVFVKKSRNSVDSLLRSSKPDKDQPSSLQSRPETPERLSTDVRPTTLRLNLTETNPSRRASGVSAASSISSGDHGRSEAPGAHQTQKKDELKSAFRSLESDCQKFLGKPVAVRTSVVRFCLFPFFAKHAPLASQDALRAEDLERRCMVYKTWWAALLQTLKAGPAESLSEVDRATLRDAIVGIMDRSEWTASRSADIRSNFAQMIYKQLSYVTDKMSQRRLPTNANLVSFCGKSCAYAFVYCPAAAELLISLWDIPTGTVKRLFRSFGMESPWKARQGNGAIARRLPRHLQSLAFSSLRGATNILRSKVQLPTELAQIQWRDSYWVARWCGRESYLFCEFLQHFHMWLGSVVPEGFPPNELLFIPGVSFVYAQLISVLDHMIHPHSNSQPSTHDQGFLSQNNDDVVKFDSAAPTIGASAATSQRPMADSHIIRLSAEFLLEHISKDRRACQIFAHGLSNTIKAAALATSLYDHAACFALCDLLQEALKILPVYERQTHPAEPVVDWPFWLNVFGKMLRSENTMTEIRLYVLLYNLWPTLAPKPSLKEKICYDLLLKADHFHSRFNHWCPMVRAYYMRLLCWRLARFDGSSSERESRLLETLLSRVQDTWSQHKSLWNRMTRQNMVPLSTTPRNPAPGRRLLIIRTDIPSSTPMSLSRVTTSTAIDSEFSFTPAQLVERLSLSANTITEPLQKKNSLLRSIMGSRTPDKGSRSNSPVRLTSTSSSSSTPQPPPKDQPPPETKDPSLRNDTSANSSARSSMYEHRPSQSSDTTTTTSTTTPFRPATFKFSLELVDPRRALLAPIDLEPPRLPLAAYQHLMSRPGFRADVPAAGQMKGRVGERDREREMELKYSGMALAEWTLVVNECQNFFERRKAEGVPGDRLVETPVLTVESLRRAAV